MLMIKKESWVTWSIKAGLILAVMIGGYLAFASRYLFAFDPQIDRCLPQYRFYLIDTKDQNVERGGIYSYSARNMSQIYPDGTKMLKIVKGIPGDSVEVSDKGVLVNGQVVANGLFLAEKLGRKADSFYGKGIIKDGEFWFMGESSTSFDSRYWGTVKHEQIIGRAYPIF